MAKTLNLKNDTLSRFLDLVFLVVLFSVPFGKLVFDHPSHDIQVYFILVLSIWGLLKIFISKLSIAKLSIFDMGVFLLFLYFLIHYYFYSEASFYYYKLWVYVAYVFLFYLFRWALVDKLKPKYFIHFAVVVIIVVCVLQYIVAILQYFEFLETRNDYFKLLGTFTTPNFLGAFLGLGLCILVWLFFVKRIRKKPWVLLGTICFILFGALIIVSNSRATWLAIIASFAVLAVTSINFRFILNKISFLKKVLAVLFIIVSVVFCSKYLYDLKPESVKGRAFVAKISLLEIGKQPIKGHGLFSFAGAYNNAKAKYFMTEQRQWEGIKVGTYVFAPFNDYMLIAFELGVIALILIIALIVFVFVKTEINIETRLGLAILINVCVLALFSSPLSSVMLMSVGLFGVAIILNYGGYDKSLVLPVSKSITNVFKILVLLLCLAGIYAVVFKLSNQNKFKNYVLKEGSIEKFIQISNAIEDNVFSDLVIGKKLYDWGHKLEGIDHIEKGFRKSSAPIVGRALAGLYLKEGNLKRAEELYKFNIHLEPYRYEARMDLMKLYIKTSQFDALIQLSQEVLDLHIKVPSKKIEIYKEIATKNIKQFTKYLKDQRYLKGSLSIGKPFYSKILDKEFLYKVYLPPIEKITKKLPVVYVNDGFTYLSRGQLHKVMDSLISNNSIEPVAAIFLEPKDRKQKGKDVRQELFLCNPKFVEFYTKEFIPFIEKSYPLSNKKENRTVLGLSFGGLSAAYLGHLASSTFKNIAMQSPVFRPCETIYEAYAKAPKKSLKMYMSYGTGNDTEKQVIPMIKILKDKGYELKIECVEEGNHNWNIWKKQVANILIYFFEKK